MVRSGVILCGLQDCGIDPDLVGAHSLRAGGAMAGDETKRMQHRRNHETWTPALPHFHDVYSQPNCSSLMRHITAHEYRSTVCKHLKLLIFFFNYFTDYDNKVLPSQGTSSALSRRPIHTFQLAPLTLTQVTDATTNAIKFYLDGRTGSYEPQSSLGESREAVVSKMTRLHSSTQGLNLVSTFFGTLGISIVTKCCYSNNPTLLHQ